MIPNIKNSKMSNTERVIRYLDGELNPAESIEFEEQLKSDTDLKVKLELVKNIEGSLKDKKVNEFRNTLKVVHRSYVNNNEDSGKIISLFRNKALLKIAASIVVLVSVTLSIYKYSFAPSLSQQLFSEYYSPYQMDIPTRSDGNVVNTLQLAFQSYENKDFNKAVNYFNQVLVSDNTMLIAYFYKGVASIEIDDYNSALKSFQKVIDNPSNPYFVQAKWYTSLVWLKLNKPENAKQHLKWLINNDRYYGEKAQNIVNQIDKK
jgi:tetratricopeptide (TPR) repeat protein